MPTPEFLPLDTRAVNVKSFDCGKDAINTYLRRYAAKNMALNLNRTFVLPYIPEAHAPKEGSGKSHVAAYYTLAHQTLVREELPPAAIPCSSDPACSTWYRPTVSPARSGG